MPLSDYWKAARAGVTAFRNSLDESRADRASVTAGDALSAADRLLAIPAKEWYARATEHTEKLSDILGPDVVYTPSHYQRMKWQSFDPVPQQPTPEPPPAPHASTDGNRSDRPPTAHETAKRQMLSDAKNPTETPLHAYYAQAARDTARAARPAATPQPEQSRRPPDQTPSSTVER